MKIQSLLPNVQALKIRELRNEVLTSNLANADTPNYKARDIDFSTALHGARSDQLRLAQTSAQHIGGLANGSTTPGAFFRTPTQPSLDGNTVDADVEQAAFAENAVAYRAALSFLNGQIRTLHLAIKGTD